VSTIEHMTDDTAQFMRRCMKVGTAECNFATYL